MCLALLSLTVASSLGCGGGGASTERQGEAPAAAAPAAASGGDSAGEEAEEIRLSTNLRPRRYDLTLALDPDRQRYTGSVEIDVEVARATSEIRMHGEAMEVEEATVEEANRDPVAVEWTVLDETQGLAVLRLPRPVQPGVIRVRVRFSSTYEPSLRGLYRATVGTDRYVFSQFEPLSARRAFPCFDEPAFKAPFDVTLAVPAGLTAVSNAEQEGAAELVDGWQRVRFATTEALPTYLIAFAVGPFDVVEGDPLPTSEVRSRPVPFRGIAPRGQGERLAYAMENTPALLAALEGYFGIAYPFDKLDLIAVPDFAAGAMENAGAITFRDRLILLNEDAGEIQKRRFAYITAHELAHQWFGNLVTMAWWDDLWLNEAFATWMQQETIRTFNDDYRPDEAEMQTLIRAMDADSLASARTIRQPIETHHDIYNAFDTITYSKGMSVLGMFEAWLTPEVFRQGVRRYLREHAERNATSDDLITALEDASGREVRGPFESFLSQPGVPLVEATLSCEGAPVLQLRQSRYLPAGSRASTEQTWQIPVCVRYEAGRETLRTCTLLGAAEGTLELESAECPDWVMPNADGRGYYRWTLDAEALESLQRRGRNDLTVRERLSYADSLEAGAAAGRVPFGEAAEALSQIARSENRALATAPLGFFRFALDYLAPNASRLSDIQRYTRRLYRGHLNRLGWVSPRNEDGERRLLRAAVLRFLALDVEEGPVRRDANNRGRDYVGYGGDRELHPNAVPPDLAELAVIVAGQNATQALFDHMFRLFRDTDDPQARAVLLAGLSRVDDDRYRRQALDLALNRNLRVNETLAPLFGQASDAEGRTEAWAWLQEHYDEVADKLGPGLSGYLPFVAAGFCSTERVEEVRAFFAPRVASTRGGPRNLDSAIESIELCAARVAAQQEGANDFFRAQ
ncbi:MAG: M1 family metallopeptidase [Sandaracinaceae bacterium]